MAAVGQQNTNRDILSLAGEWQVRLDHENTGIREKWFTQTFDQTLSLPGTTDEVQMGELTGERCTDRLSRTWRWIGPAWYQRSVTIPKAWKGRKIILFLERTKDSQVWVDGTWVGSDDSLSTPHEFDLSQTLTPGTHTLTILIDNAKLPPVGPCHQVDERTQTNWNGIVGRIELQAHDPLWVQSVQVHPNRGNETLEVVTTLLNETKRALSTRIGYRVQVVGAEGDFPAARRSETVKCSKGVTVQRYIFKLPKGLPQWNEFDTTLLRMSVTAAAALGSRKLRDSREVLFGLREFSARRGRFLINGRPTFLRGKNDCATFPLTGYAPMEKTEWLRLLGVARDHGINHYRFHSWCPPEAAFAAADELGIYFQVELPNKRGITEPDNKDYSPPKEAYETLVELEGDDGPPAVRTAYLAREGERILKTFGNHPSFVMLTLGNELGGDEAVMKGLCDHFRELDPRHLYATGTGHWHWDIRLREGDDFWVTRGTAQKGLSVRGASWEQECHIDHQPPSTTVDYSEAIQGIQVPVVGHENAQFEVFPDFDEIQKYTGVLKAHNFEIFRERLRQAGLLHQARDFFKASGACSVICHREDIEAGLRTAGFGGFQLLDIQDFSGQGTALIGMLDVFMDSKGLIQPKKWREFCCETVPLLWMTKYTWRNDETFNGRIRVAHYGPHDLPDQVVDWSLKAGRKTVARGESRALTLPTGTVTEVDLFSAPLRGLRKAQKLCCTLKLRGTKYQNSWDLWVYPAKTKTTPPESLTVARTFSPKVKKALRAGGTVLLMPKPEELKKTVAMAFQTGFWSPMFRNKPGRLNPMGKETPGTQGILCDPTHPLFKHFPTEYHSNWQWWQLVKNSRAMILDDLPAELTPVVQVVDGFDRNHKLGLIVEAQVGGGRLILCSIDLPNLQEHPEARQLLSSMQRYMSSRSFKPGVEVSQRALTQLLAKA